MEQHDRIALARLGYVHAQAGEIDEAVLDAVEFWERKRDQSILSCGPASRGTPALTRSQRARTDPLTLARFYRRREAITALTGRRVTASDDLHHATIARFICRHERALADLFSDVLKLCDRAGLVKPGVVSIDGTRIAGNASPEVNYGFDQIAREIVAERSRAMQDERGCRARAFDSQKGARCQQSLKLGGRRWDAARTPSWKSRVSIRRSCSAASRSVAVQMPRTRSPRIVWRIHRTASGAQAAICAASARASARISSAGTSRRRARATAPSLLPLVVR